MFWTSREGSVIHQRLVLHYLYALYNLKQRALRLAYILTWHVIG